MPPLAPAAEQKSGPRQRQAEKAGGAAAAPRDALARRSASFHGPGSAEQRHQLLRQRPRTQPDLLAGFREQGLQRGAGTDAAAVPWAGGGGRTAAPPSKVLVTVAVQRSMWPLHVMARRRPGRRRGGALRQGRPPAAAAVGRPLGVHPPLFPVQPAEIGPGREAHGAGKQELLPLLQSCTS
ncbi:hypothetical protein QOZ80_2BG0188010 [Eleusine coracana subsp. coracana]|nr:hypothetical protein QOZ80_2BG0188010 [Eleusine coracana subsp. coracana]